MPPFWHSGTRQIPEMYRGCILTLYDFVDKKHGLKRKIGANDKNRKETARECRTAGAVSLSPPRRRRARPQIAGP